MLQAIIGALCGVGLFFVLADVYRIPYLKTSKAVESLSKQQKEKTSALNIWLGNLAEFLARHMLKMRKDCLGRENCTDAIMLSERHYSIYVNM